MKRTIFIGQAMPRKKSELHDWSSLNNWIYSIGIIDNQIREHFFYSALVDYFPGSKNGSHLVPTREEIEAERPRLKITLTDFDPEIVVPVGALSIAYCLDRKVEPLVNNIGKVFEADPYNMLGKELPIIPLPHPSGASTWRHMGNNKRLLGLALENIKNYLT